MVSIFVRLELLLGISVLLLQSEAFSPAPSPANTRVGLCSALHFQSEVGGEASLKDEVLALLSSTPNNAPTSRELTNAILNKIDQLEESCPTKEEDVLDSLSGNWELMWTAQVGG